MNTKQLGFNLPVIIGAILVIVLLGYAGYRVYNANTSKPTSTNTTTSTQATNTTNSSNSQATNTQAATYLDIKELRIKIKLDDRIKDAIYNVGTSSDGSRFAHVSTQTLSGKSNGSCGLDGTPIASITELSGTNLTVDNTNTFKVGNDYFVITGPRLPAQKTLLFKI
jgi:hypothetical protein